MSSHVPREREGVQRRQNLLLQQEEEIFNSFMEDDQIKSYDDFLLRYASKSDCSKWIANRGADNVLFFQLTNHDGSNISKVAVSFKIYENWSVSVHYMDEPLSISKFQYILGKDLKCSRWSIFDNLLSQLNEYDHRISSEEALPELLNKLDEMMEQKLGVDFAKYCRLKEQILLLGNSKRKRYSPELIVLASSIFHCSPAAYNFLRETFFLTLPNVDYIRKFGSSNDIDSPGITDDHVSYLKQRLSGLSEDKKLLNSVCQA